MMSIEHINKKFELVTWQNKDIVDREFIDCSFIQCNLSKLNFINCYFEDCTFDHCYLSMIKLKMSSFRGVSFNNCKVIGVNWYDLSDPISLKFNSSIINYSSFINQDLRNCSFIDCQAKEMLFNEVDLRKVKLFKTNFAKTVFNNCDLRGTNFESSTNYYIDIKQNQIEKAIFSMPEVLSLLSGLGIIIKN